MAPILRHCPNFYFTYPRQLFGSGVTSFKITVPGSRSATRYDSVRDENEILKTFVGPSTYLVYLVPPLFRSYVGTYAYSRAYQVQSKKNEVFASCRPSFCIRSIRCPISHQIVPPWLPLFLCRCGYLLDGHASAYHRRHKQQ